LNEEEGRKKQLRLKEEEGMRKIEEKGRRKEEGEMQIRIKRRDKCI